MSERRHPDAAVRATHTRPAGALRWLLATPLVAAVLAACAVGPDYVRPAYVDPAVTKTADFAHADAALTRATASEAAFWHRLGDPLLARLIEDALGGNHDLRIALARWEQSRALLRETTLDRLPALTASATAADARLSAAEAPGLPRDARDGERHDAGINAFWELDLFGRVRRQVEAGQAASEASAADFAAVQVAVAGELARNYFTLRGLQEQLRVARGNAGNQEQSLALVETRLEAGRGTGFDTARARAQLESTRARIPALEAQIAVAAHRIAVLTGREPATLLSELQSDLPLPPLPAAIAIGTPADMLQRRPDVAAAERRLAAATARIGVATADLYPRFTLTGLLGSQALDAGDLFERDSEQRLVALGIDWSFLDAARVRARIAAADADAAAQLARFEQAVLRALEEAENALVAYTHAERERAHLQQAADAGAQAARLARLRFEGGVVDFLDVLDAERVQLDAEGRLADARTRQGTALVSLYAALAGGWPERMPEARALRAAPSP